MMHESERGANRGIAKRAQPSRPSSWPFSQPYPNGLDEEHIEQARDDCGGAHPGMLRFTLQEPRSRIEPLVSTKVVLSHTNPLGEDSEKRLRVRTFELERPTE
jgi:hypothetical protein